jgi:two-component system nitrate/nitrite sensor histidine kinase NarX
MIMNRAEAMSCGGCHQNSNDTELHLVAQKGVIDDQGQQIDVVSSACFCGEVAMAPDSCVQFSVRKSFVPKSREFLVIRINAPAKAPVA